MSTADRGLYHEGKAWLKEHRLRTVGAFWATCLASSLAWNFSGPGRLSHKIIHARVHAQMLVLAGIAAGGVIEYYDRQQRQKDQQV